MIYVNLNENRLKFFWSDIKVFIKFFFFVKIKYEISRDISFRNSIEGEPKSYNIFKN